MRNPAAIGRIFQTGFCPGAEWPWQSVWAFEDLVGQLRELEFDEVALLEPEPDEWATFERAVNKFIPSCSQSAAAVVGDEAPSSV